MLDPELKNASDSKAKRLAEHRHVHDHVSQESRCGLQCLAHHGPPALEYNGEGAIDPGATRQRIQILIQSLVTNFELVTQR